MNIMYRISMVLLWCMLSLGVYAQSSHWRCEDRAFQYDMTAYVSLTDNDGNVVALVDYEIAAFVNNECRGMAKVQTVEDITYGYLRIRSNATSGETVTFKVYNRQTGKERSIEGYGIAFEADAVQGMPSAPLVLKMAPPYILGDVNNDDKVDIIDVMAVYAYILNQQPTPFNVDAADVNGDNKVNILDVQRLYSIILNQE